MPLRLLARYSCRLARFTALALALAPALAPVRAQTGSTPPAPGGAAEPTPAPPLDLAWPDGKPRVHCEQALDAKGETVRHGACQEWHKNGELAAEGRYELGQRSGEWRFLHDTGKLAAKGIYVAGDKNQIWDVYWPDGAKRAHGKYRGDLREGHWSVWGPEGALDAEESGSYSIVKGDFTPNQPMFRGEQKNGLPHGRWKIWWKNGRLQLDARYRAGQASGLWRYFHVDGTYDPGFLSGYWEHGERVGDAQAEPPERLPIEYAAEPSSAPIEPALVALARLGSPGLDAAGEKALTARIHAAVALPDADWSAQRDELARSGLDAYPMIWNALLDTLREAREASAGPEVLLRSRRIHELLVQTCGLERDDLFGARLDGLEAARLQTLRWHSLWKLVSEKARARFWKLERPAWIEAGTPAARALVLGGLLSESLGRGEGAMGAAWTSGAARLELDGSGALPAGSENGAAALRAAMDWILRHQNSAGGWDSDVFSQRCSGGSCDGPGAQVYRVGESGLCALVLLGAGNTTGRGAHAPALKLAVEYLIGQQDPKTGAIGTAGDAVPYAHAIATQALCEASAFSLDPALRKHAEQAVRFLLDARTKDKGWNDKLPSDGTNSSVTAWAVQALVAARGAGLEVPDAAFSGPRDAIVELSDPVLGRTGFNKRGGLSARMTDVNGKFAPSIAEPMTGAGLFVRAAAGDKLGDALGGKQAALIVGKLPFWDPNPTAKKNCDVYGWYWGSQGLFAQAGEPWKRWWPALVEQAARAQANDGCKKGSIDPLDPWGLVAGRVYTTAMVALALETPVRGIQSAK